MVYVDAVPRHCSCDGGSRNKLQCGVLVVMGGGVKYSTVGVFCITIRWTGVVVGV